MVASDFLQCFAAIRRKAEEKQQLKQTATRQASQKALSWQHCSFGATKYSHEQENESWFVLFDYIPVALFDLIVSVVHDTDLFYKQRTL